MVNKKMEHVCSACENCINCPATDDDLFLDDTGHVAECKRYKKNNKKYLVIVRNAKSKAVLHRYFSNELPEGNKKKPAPKKSKSEDKQVKRFTPPTLEEVKAYCAERNNTVDAEQFVDHYTSNGWLVGGKSKMKDWKAAVRTWERNGFAEKRKPGQISGKASYDIDQIKADALVNTEIKGL